MKKSQSNLAQIRSILRELSTTDSIQRAQKLQTLIKRFPKHDKDTLSKSELLAEYLKHFPEPDPEILKLLKKKPIRTLSGVTPVTVLTKPYPCPGECIFCPADVRMPKSYIATEPGAARAGQNGFDPYLQVYNRLLAYHEIGHPVSKVELIVLGGTWSVYPREYQVWFITRLFEALNDFSTQTDLRPEIRQVDLTASLPPGEKYNTYIASATPYVRNKEQSTWEELFKAQKQNEHAACRCVGLVLETRPDYLNEREIINLRRLGATKIQLGLQSLSDRVLALNKRGATVAQSEAAINRLRLAGFKIHAHWMPNLYGSSVTADIADFNRLFKNPSICPDELKVYPTSLIDKTELMAIYQRGEWQPYDQRELSEVLEHVLTHTPEYCRLTRIIRDIPGTEIITGNKTTNFRQLLEAKIDSSHLHDIRSREIKQRQVDAKSLVLDDLVYETAVATEHFLQFITPERQITAFLRLSLPKTRGFIRELEGHSLIREVHVYGQSLTIGNTAAEGMQHQGLGKQLIQKAKVISCEQGFHSIAVISAVGTRDYYRRLGFTDGDLYQHAPVVLD